MSAFLQNLADGFAAQLRRKAFGLLGYRIGRDGDDDRALGKFVQRSQAMH